ncbi:MAG: MerR family transcriptional regulator [bacterium]
MNGPNIKRLYYSTSEVSRLVKVKPYVIRKWEEKFSFLNSVKKQSGRRFFKPSDLDIIFEIKRLKDIGYTNEKIHEIITTNDYTTSEDTMKSSNNSRTMPLFQEIRRGLQEILEILK